MPEIIHRTRCADLEGAPSCCFSCHTSPTVTLFETVYLSEEGHERRALVCCTVRDWLQPDEAREGEHDAPA